MIGLVPLNALRAFEAAARRGGFAAAADELNVTPAAVGQQVRQLEALIGAPLFDRAGRQLILTERGAAALAPLRRGFELMGEASAALREPHAALEIKIAAPRELLGAWLASDVASWTGRAKLELVSLADPETATAAFRDGADLALVYKRALDHGPNHLMGETVTPLASPALKLEGQGLNRLDGVPLIEDSSLGVGWPQWAAARGAYGAQLNPSIRADDAATAVALALDGAGVLLARKPLCFDAIRAGWLSPVFPDGDLVVERGYELAIAPGAADNPVLQELAAHLKLRAARRLDLSGEL